MPSISLPDSLVGRLVPEGARRDDYTEEEARNVEHVIALRFAPVADRPLYSHSTGEPPNRFGFEMLGQRAKEQGKLGSFLAGVTDRVDEFIDIVAKGDRVWTAFRVTGTHSAELWGFPPTGNRISILEFGIYRLTDGKIAEAWYFGDELDLFEKLGGKTVLGSGDAKP